MCHDTQGMWKPFLFAWVHLFLITVCGTLSRIKWFLSLPKYWGQMDRAPSVGRPIGYAVFCWWPSRHRSTWNCACPSHAASGQCWAGSKISPRELRRCFTVTLLVLYYFKMWILATTILSGSLYLFIQQCFLYSSFHLFSCFLGWQLWRNIPVWNHWLGHSLRLRHSCILGLLKATSSPCNQCVDCISAAGNVFCYGS